MKVLFDNSVHLGQFCITNEQIRISAKNSQIAVSQKPNAECLGIESFNENTFSDDIIWGIAREPQSVFYKFMDVYHSIKNIDRVPLSNEDAESALKISNELSINISNALTCAIAIRNSADYVYSFYSEFMQKRVVDFLALHGVLIKNFSTDTEQLFVGDNLEKYYQDALSIFRRSQIDLVSQFHI